MDLGLLLFGVAGIAYGLVGKSKTEIPKLPDLHQGRHYEAKDAKEITACLDEREQLKTRIHLSPSDLSKAAKERIAELEQEIADLQTCRLADFSN